MNFELEKSWDKALVEEFSKEYYTNLIGFITKEYSTNTIFPPSDSIFKAFELCPFEKVRVIIIGQDPYHEIGQAQGLSFSVADGVTIPPSLRNIYREIEDDIGTVTSQNGDLNIWAKQGVLLLNATLTVRAEHAGSHQGKGWEEFTDAVISKLSDERENLVFILWGKYAESKGDLIDTKKHLVLIAPHPSPFSVFKGFFGCKHFSKTNKYLEEKGYKPIIW